MAGKTNWGEDHFLRHFFYEHTTFAVSWHPVGSGWNLALFTSPPSDAYNYPTVMDGVEVSGAGYARKYIAPATWSSGNSAVISNASVINFGLPTASWGTISHWGLFVFDNDQLMYWGPITNGSGTPTPIAVGAYNNVSFPAGTLQITDDGIKGDLARQLWFDRMFRGQANAWTGTWYLGLFNTSPSDTGGGTELSGGNYGRLAINATGSASSVFGIPSGTPRTCTNDTLIQFPNPTANWGTANYWGLSTNATPGTACAFYGPLAVPRDCNLGQNVVIPPGEMDVTED